MNETTEATQRSEYIASLRALADLIEATPDLPLPSDYGVNWYLFGTDWNGRQKLSYEDQKAQAALFVRLLPGQQKKQETGDLFRFVGKIGCLPTQVIVDRDAVCRRVVTGTREVTETVPAPDAPMVEITKTVEDVEWICEPLLADAVSA